MRDVLQRADTIFFRILRVLTAKIWFTTTLEHRMCMTYGWLVNFYSKNVGILIEGKNCHLIYCDRCQVQKVRSMLLVIQILVGHCLVCMFYRCFTLHFSKIFWSTIFQSLLWRHIYVQAIEEGFTYCRAPSLWTDWIYVPDLAQILDHPLRGLSKRLDHPPPPPRAIRWDSNIRTKDDSRVITPRPRTTVISFMWQRSLLGHLRVCIDCEQIGFYVPDLAQILDHPLHGLSKRTHSPPPPRAIRWDSNLRPKDNSRVISSMWQRSLLGHLRVCIDCEQIGFYVPDLAQILDHSLHGLCKRTDPPPPPCHSLGFELDLTPRPRTTVISSVWRRSLLSHFGVFRFELIADDGIWWQHWFCQKPV